MRPQSNRWAQRQFLWGIAFAIALLLLLFWLAPVLFGRLGTQQPAPTAAPPADAGYAADIADAQATIDAARNAPANLGAVIAAANTVVAATTTPKAPTPTPAVSVMPDAEDFGLSSTLDTAVASIPALSAIVTFVGLVFSSLMKWRTDLRDSERQEFFLEQQRLGLELERERHQLESRRAAFELERQRFQLEVERRQLELKRIEERLLQDRQNT